MSNVIIDGTISKIYPVSPFTWQGTTYNYQEIILDTQAYKEPDKVCVKFDIDKVNTSNFKKGDYVKLQCNVKSKSTTTKDGRTFWNTTIKAWKLESLNGSGNQQQTQQQMYQQPVQQQPVQTVNQNPMNGVPTLNQDGTPQSQQGNDLPF